MLSTLLSMAALTIAFSALLKQQIANYPAYFLAGSVFWAFFAQATSHAASLTMDASEIARRVYVPRSVFVATAVGVALVNLLYSLVPLLVIFVVTGQPIHLTWLFLPVSIVTGVFFTAGVGLVVFTMASRFVDVKETYLVLLSAWFFLTPIVYTPAVLAPKYRLVIRFNPMTYLVEMFRAPLYDGWLPGANTVAFSLLASGASLVVGWLFYAAKIEDYGTRH
jgi:ABC-type polysaccharide/polyol phosphate export permease